MKYKYLFLLMLALIFFSIVSCSKTSENNKIEEQLNRKDINAVISDYIISEHSNLWQKCDKAFEIHKTYGTDADVDNIYVYTLVLYRQYDFVEKMFKNTSGSTEPTVFILKQNSEGEYNVESNSIPEGGEGYYDNIRKLFTDKYFIQVQSDLHDDRLLNGLLNTMHENITEWLKTQGKSEYAIE